MKYHEIMEFATGKLGCKRLLFCGIVNLIWVSENVVYP